MVIFFLSIPPLLSTSMHTHTRTERERPGAGGAHTEQGEDWLFFAQTIAHASMMSWLPSMLCAFYDMRPPPSGFAA
jgi:hypothetical protein